MKKLLCLSTAVICWGFASAQNGVPSSGFNVNNTNERNDLPSFVSFSANNRPDQNGLESWIQKNIGANQYFQLKEVKQAKDQAGNTHIRYKQYYRGFPVEGAMVNLHFKGKNAHSFNGVYYPSIFVSTGIKIGEETAFNTAKSYFQNATFAWESESYEKMLKRSKNNSDATSLPKADLAILETGSNTFRLAYSFDIYTVAPLAHKLLYIDAQTGTILKAKELLMDIEVSGKAHTKYSGIQTIQCDSVDPSGFILEEWNRGAHISTSRYLSFSGSGIDTEPFYDYDNDWNNINSELDEVATDIQWGLEKTHDFYKSKFGINSIDDAGHELTAIAHFTPYFDGTKYANAAWTGDMMIYGDGNDTSMNPLTSIDITGHEVSHGLTQNTAGLDYSYESGALNESFSDIFGKSIEHYALPDSFSWQMGKKIMFPGKPSMRDMSDPNPFKNPKFYKGLYYYTGSLDNGGVHTNSGVQNYWFYLLVEGRKSVRESDFQPYEVEAMGFDTAVQIAYTTLTSYLTPTSNYKDAANASLAYTKLTYGDSSDQAYNVQMAWYAVGVLDKPVKKDTAVTEEPSSIESIGSVNAIKIYPNPTTDLVTISAANTLNNAKLQLLNLTGQVLITKDHITGTIVSLDVSAQPAGMYILEIKEDGIVTSRTKMMKK